MAKPKEKPDVDLFGAPVDQVNEVWGRPRRKFSEKDHKLVALAAARGWSQSRICKMMGCSEKTLRKNFSLEMENGSDLIETRAMQIAIKKMDEGNIAAVGRVLGMVDKGKAARAPKLTKQNTSTKSKAPVLGKKELAEIQASEAPDAWADLVNDDQPQN